MNAKYFLPAAGLLAAFFNANATISFETLGDLSGGIIRSAARDVSADGSVVVGYSYSTNGRESFRWTRAGGMVGLGDLPGGDYSSRALGVSADGSVVVGRGSGDSGTEAYRWTSAGGMNGLGSLVEERFYSDAKAVSDNGVVVGESQSSATDSDDEAFRWTSDGGMVSIGDLPGGDVDAVAEDVSADGSVIVGTGYNTNGRSAFRWTSGNGMESLGDLGGNGSGAANAVSTDGSVIVGKADHLDGAQAFRWTSEGMVGLGRLHGGETEALDVSGDGSTIIGREVDDFGEEYSFIWDEENGMRDLSVVLSDAGIDVSDWNSLDAKAISDDGSTIVGQGTNSDWNAEAWMISGIPEPADAAGFLGLVALVVVVSCRRCG